MFPKGTLYSTKFADMNKYCPCCGQSFEPEPGYYYGAMYVSFGFNVGVFLVVLLVLSQFVEEVTMVMLVGIVLVTVLGMLPIFFRLARVLWISIFVRFEGPASQIPQKQHV
ncbi:DUF983 domain-containing protein [Rufibacter latericius]|uniref:DUF983 domain-containing protein n=1 Tax=Rufibacter latericius TaxID=2487040 RepID=A0A3M9MUZ0_9BACT|nr:DUF983 domain-containing protein [Rufibacter latericius]RNI29352.1 DUF983 domain-containing protein [Rufibacter latericius]